MSSPISFPELYKAGFDDFIIPSHEIAPFTTIQNRAKVTRSLKAIAGVERVMVRGVNRLQNEFGPNGEQVWEADNKDSRIRFVGGWLQSSDGNGSKVYSSANITDYAEITFYGTGLNIVTIVNSSGYNFVASVDGGAEGSNLVPASYSGAIASRNYSSNQIISVASSLTLGWHTVKIRNNTVSNNTIAYGFEILNQRTDLAVYQGSGIAQGALNGLSSLATSSFTDGVTGTRGARVVKYIDNGTLKSAVQEVNASAAYLASANHTNEEVVRRINFREFGANRADDFSTLAGTNSARAFTLDDGTTTLVVNVGVVATYNSTEVLAIIEGGSNFATLTFIGTGLDFIGSSDGSSRQLNFSIDGGSTITGYSYGAVGTQRFAVCSGLPYGTHTVRFINPNGISRGIGISDFIIYQPKKPSIPAGAFEVADYCLNANFVANSTQNISSVATGVLRKYSLREFTYTGTWDIVTANIATSDGGFLARTTTAGSTARISFWGTGFSLKIRVDASTSSSVSVNGSTNLSGLTTSFVGAGTFTAATGTIAGATNENAVLNVSGLSLGWHSIIITHVSGTNSTMIHALDIATPIHINQPSLKTGSLSLKSATKYSPEKVVSNAGPDLSKAKAWVVFDGVNQIIYSSYNVQAVLRTATGVFYVYFEKPFKIRGSSPYGLVGSVLVSSSLAETQNSGFTNSYCLIETSGSGGVKTNAGLITMVAYGELVDE
jgi:hypothetical protein